MIFNTPHKSPLSLRLPLLAMLMAAAAGLLGYAASQDTSEPETPPEANHDSAYLRNLQIFTALTNELENNYVDSIRTDEAFEAAISGMLATVDPYTEYYSYKDRERLMKMTTGAYAGIGSYITTRDGWTYISNPIAGSPAEKAGLRAGDRILRIDSIGAHGKTTEQVSSKLKGAPGTSVKVEIFRPYAADGDSLLTFTIGRELVAEPSVPWWGVVDGNTGYIRLTQFVESSADDVRKALESFKENPEVKNVVLDLRGNGGGLVDSAIEILGFFLPKGTEVLRTKGKNAADERTYKTRRTPIMPDTPLAALIDGGSASASEIVAGALQDLDRAVLIGSRSFGKGLVQGTRPLPYNTLLKVTTAKYYMPSGRLIQALDYSRKDAEGRVMRTPDSLTHVFKTLHGREVRDGGGLTPDSVIDWGTYTAVAYGLLAGNHVFDYATKYAATHPKPASPGDIRISDADYEDFVMSVDTATFKYDHVCLEMLKSLRETSKNEGYLDSATAALIDSLQTRLNRELRADLRGRRDEISDYIDEEIAGRYFGEAGRTQRTICRDKAMDMAEKIFATPGLYEKILAAPAAPDKKGKRGETSRQPKKGK